MPLSQGQIINNRYRTVNLLGQGGFGAVYKAWDMNLNGTCALKENLDTSPEAQRQFTREATLLATLHHPNLPRVMDHFILPSQGQYLVMDYVEGEDLQAMLDRTGGPLPEATVLPWISQVCDALSYMHAQKSPVIHRDIKPANIKITPEGQAMLVDFGIAKVYDPNLKTTLGARAVTPGYSPPEQYGQGKTDQRSDIYSLGATLYTLLTGQTPPDSVDVMTNKVAHPLPVSTLNPKVSPQVSAVVEKAMQSDWSLRFTSVSEFAAKLQPKPVMQQPQPVSVNSGLTAPVHPPAPAQSPSRSLQWKWALAGLLILALLLGSGWAIKYFTGRSTIPPTDLNGAAISTHTPRPNATSSPPTQTETSETHPATDTSVSPTIIPTQTETPRPLSNIAQRNIWARSGCYAGYSAVGIIPAGGTVRFLPSVRRFDDFNRECALVDYQRGGVDVIGWVLLADLAALPPPTPTPSS